jgi:hypothetical protein
MGSIKGLHALCRTLMPAAIEAMQKEYTKRNRVKLTHYWLAEQMGIENRVAFALLAKIAQKKILCVRLPNGPIYWDNDKLTIGDLIKMEAEGKISLGLASARLTR